MKLQDGDVVFRRASNGWMVVELDVNESGEALERLSVFEDPEGASEDVGQAQSLSAALWQAFQGWYRQKWRAGLVVAVKPGHGS